MINQLERQFNDRVHKGTSDLEHEGTSSLGYEVDLYILMKDMILYTRMSELLIMVQDVKPEVRTNLVPIKAKRARRDYHNFEKLKLCDCIIIYLFLSALALHL